MSLLKKIKEHGIKGTARVVLYYITFAINAIEYYLCWLLPLNKQLIVMESEGDLSDNSYAVYDYLVRTDMMKNYKVLWLVDNVKRAREYGMKKKLNNTTFAQKTFTHVSFSRNMCLATCKWYIYDHCNIYEAIKVRKGCKVVNLCHGVTFKKKKGASEKIRNKTSTLITTSDFWLKSMSHFYSARIECAKPLGFPRNDYLFMDNDYIKDKVINGKSINDFKKTVIWMPTFRKSIRSKLSEEYYTGETGLPILTTASDLSAFDKILRDMGALLIFKIHHLQADVDCYKKEYTNILILTDDELFKLNIQLYQLVSVTDILVTDYSSIYFDYLLINRPVVFTMDDYDDYRLSRGFSIDDPARYLSGHHVKTKDELFAAIESVVGGNDPYKEQRQRLLAIMHKYHDGNSSQRIVRYLGIESR